MRPSGPSPFTVAALALAAAVAVAAGCSSSTAKDAPPVPIAVAITSPAPGAELVAGEHPTITVSGTVSGTVSDATGAALEAWVNGMRVDVVGGAFTAEVAPEVGINHIKVEGGDGATPLVSQELDVTWAPDYLAPHAGQTAFDLPGALELRLGQRFFDARLLGTALDRTTDPVVARDVASALELILWNIDLARLLPGGLHLGQGDTALDIAIPSVAPRDIVVDAQIVGAPQPAIALRIDLTGVVLAMTGQFTLVGDSFTVAGGITADLHATAQLTLGTAQDGAQNRAIAVAVTGVTASVGALSPAFTGDQGGELDAFVISGNNAFRTLIEGLLRDRLIPTFTDRLPPLLSSALGAADQLLANLSFTLDPGLGHPVALELGGQLGALDVAAGASDDHVAVREDLTVAALAPPIHAASRGAARLDTAQVAPVFDPSGVHLGIRLDFLNAVLHALWNAGLLEGQLTTNGLAAKVSAALPPIARPVPASSACKIDGERCDIQVQLGQLAIELPDVGQSFGINASAGARIKVSGSTVSLAIEKVPELRVWDTSAKPGGPLTPGGVSLLITQFIWPRLFGAIGDNLAFQLPLPDLTSLGLGDLAPGLAGARIALQAGARPSVTGSQIVLSADLVLATPAP